MSGTVIALLSFALMLGSATISTWLRDRVRALQGAATREVVRQGIGMVAVLAAIIIGGGVASMKSTYDGADFNVRRLATQIEDLDRLLGRLGPPAVDARDLLFRYTAVVLGEVWPSLDPGLVSERRSANDLQDELEIMLAGLAPDPVQPGLLPQAQAVLHAIVETRWAMSEHEGRLIPAWQFALLMAWLMLIFAGLGLAAPRSILVSMVLVLCAGALSSGLFLMSEFDDPFVGVLVVSGEPLLKTLHELADR